MNTTNLKVVVRGAYDLQKLRIQMGNRIVSNWKDKSGQKPGELEETLDKDDKTLLEVIRLSYRRLTDGLINLPRKKSFKGDGVISDYTELVLVSQYIELQRAEEAQFKHLGATLEDYPIYTDFLEPIKGIGPAMAGVIISEIDITKAEYPSSLHAYAGLDVAPDGKGRSKRSEHLIDVAYTDAKGKTQTRKSITFNPFLKTKLIGVLGPSFLRAGNEEYRKVYDDYKRRLVNHPKHCDFIKTSGPGPDRLEYQKTKAGAYKRKAQALMLPVGMEKITDAIHLDDVGAYVMPDASIYKMGKTPGHRNNMAVRYTAKRFLVDLYVAWRTIEGLPVAEEYSVAKLGMIHGKTT